MFIKPQLITPYATITFDDPKGEKFRYTKVVRTMPKAPTIIRPHPHGIDVETIRRMLLDTHFQIPTVDDKMILKVRKELGLSKKNLNYSGNNAKGAKKMEKFVATSSCCYSHDVFFKNGF